MARGRIISTQVASDPELNRLSPGAELLYLRTLPHLDRDGLISGVPMLLWATVAPLRIELMDKAPSLIDEWVTQGLVIRYDGPDGPVLFFKGFRRHQANLPYGKEQPSRFPPPPGWVRVKQGMIPADPDLCRALVEAFDPRSAYRRELERVVQGSGPGRDPVGSRSRPGRDEDQDQENRTEDQEKRTEVVCFDDDDGDSFSSLLFKEKNGECRIRAEGTAESGGQLRAWCMAQVTDRLPDWLGADRRIEEATPRQLVALSTWLYAYGRLHVVDRYSIDEYEAKQQFLRDCRDLFEGVQNPVGKIITHAFEHENPYPLSADALSDLNAQIERFADPMAILFGDEREVGRGNGRRSGRRSSATSLRGGGGGEDVDL